MINEYYITESAIIKRVFSVKAHSVEEAKEKFNKEGGEYCLPDESSKAEKILLNHFLDKIQ